MKFRTAIVTCSSLLAFTVCAQAQNNPSNQAGSKVDPAVCNRLIPQIKQEADQCIKIKEQMQRKMCFEKIGQSIQKTAPNGGCDQALNPIKKEYMAKEKQLYPTQPSALEGGSNGGGGQSGQPNQPGQMGQPTSGQPNQPNQPGQGQGQGQGQGPAVPAAVCEKLPQMIKPKAEECLKIKEQPARSQCFDRIGQEIGKVAPNGACDKAIEPLKREIMAKEKQMYPKQNPSIK